MAPPAMYDLWNRQPVSVAKMAEVVLDHRDQLVLLEARNRLRLNRPADVIAQAEALLLVGIESPSLILLAGLNAKTSPFTEVDAFLEAAMVEFGLASHLDEEAWRVVAIDYARRTLAGELDVAAGTRLLAALSHGLNGPEELRPFWFAADEWTEPFKIRRSVEESLRHEMHALWAKLGPVNRDASEP